MVFDGLLESPGSSLEVTSAVLGCAARLSATVAPTASHSAASAGLLEWVLHAVLSLLTQLQPTPTPTPTPQQQPRGPVRSPDQQRTLAGHLVIVVHAIYTHNIRLPRLQNQLMV